MYTDMELYPNTDNPDDGLRLDWWDTDEHRGYTYSGIIERPITHKVTEIENIHGEYFGQIETERAVDEDGYHEEYLTKMIDLICEFCV